jgi:hypothetical protein
MGFEGFLWAEIDRRGLVYVCVENSERGMFLTVPLGAGRLRLGVTHRFVRALENRHKLAKFAPEMVDELEAILTGCSD